ncbi:MAG TPA: NAD(P)-dependent oxidoreductase [Burkholderiales bacterium]|nr:NAD(P)-dependent oxidoreductase [Burkholderiales bacterium]
MKRRKSAGSAGRVGQIGLGIMGGAFARHLREAGFEVSGFDLDARRRKVLEALGGKAETSIGDVAARCETIITSLPSVRAVEAVFFGPGGLAERAAPGTIVIETSTLPLEVKLDVRDRCAARRLIVLDCPISGTGAQAAAKDISVYASGPRAAVRRCETVFAGFARSMHYCGEFGSGSKLKFIANLLVTIHNLSAAEAIVLGRRSGLDLDLLYKVIRDGAGTSRMFEVRAPLMIRRDYGEATMKVDVYQKDIDIIGAYASALHCPTPLFEASKAYYAAAHARGHAKDDTAAICAVLEAMAGTGPASKSRRKATPKSRKTRT